MSKSQRIKTLVAAFVWGVLFLMLVLIIAALGGFETPSSEHVLTLLFGAGLIASGVVLFTPLLTLDAILEGLSTLKKMGIAIVIVVLGLALLVLVFRGG